MEDVAGVFIQDIHPIYTKIKKHLRSIYIYQVHPILESFKLMKMKK